MTGQFRQYAPDIILRPFGGYTSIPFKYEIAKDPEKMYSRFRKPIVILYFGDCDKAGFEILESSVFGDRGLQKWCAVPFEVVRCGLTQEQAEAFEVPKNPEIINGKHSQTSKQQQSFKIHSLNI